jgi:hypothetical protein
MPADLQELRAKSVGKLRQLVSFLYASAPSITARNWLEFRHREGWPIADAHEVYTVVFASGYFEKTVPHPILVSSCRLLVHP